MAQVEAARARGLNVTCDMHTRGLRRHEPQCGPASLDHRGRPEFPGAASAQSCRPQRAQEISQYRRGGSAGRWDKILLFECKAQPELSRPQLLPMSLLPEASSRSTQSTTSCSAEIDTLHEVMIIELIYDESDLRLPFYHPSCMVGSDATALAKSGPLAGRCFHRRLYMGNLVPSSFRARKEGPNARGGDSPPHFPAGRNVRHQGSRCDPKRSVGGSATSSTRLSCGMASASLRAKPDARRVSSTFW